MDCRIGCGACCIAPSISSAIPGMLGGKPAGERCIQLTEDNRCKLFGEMSRPKVCLSIQPSVELCCKSFSEAMINITLLEEATKPGK